MRSKASIRLLRMLRFDQFESLYSIVSNASIRLVRKPLFDCIECFDSISSKGSIRLYRMPLFDCFECIGSIDSIFGNTLIWYFLAESQIYHQPKATPWVIMNSRMAIFALKGQNNSYVQRYSSL